jgi:hypothetical protein
MSIASRHGKLFVGGKDDPTRWARIEDLLTADVFGAYRYLPPTLGVVPLLARAVRGDGLTMKAWAAAQRIEWASLTHAQIVFWPSFEGREPDLLVGLGSSLGDLTLLVLIEAKLHAEQHWIEDIPQLAYYGSRLLDGELDETLEDELFETDLPAHRPLVLLTKGTEVPGEELDLARRTLSEHVEDGRTDVFWVSWHVAREVAEEQLAAHEESNGSAHVGAVLSDLLEDLRARGFGPPRKRLGWPLTLTMPLDPSIEPLLRRSPTPARRWTPAATLTLDPLVPLEPALRDWRAR